MWRRRDLFGTWERCGCCRKELLGPRPLSTTRAAHCCCLVGEGIKKSTWDSPKYIYPAADAISAALCRVPLAKIWTSPAVVDRFAATSTIPGA